MKLTRCDKIENHFYDREKYSCCPDCYGKENAKIGRAAKIRYVSNSQQVGGESAVKGSDADDRTVAMYDEADDGRTVAMYDEADDDRTVAMYDISENDESGGDNSSSITLEMYDDGETSLSEAERMHEEDNGEVNEDFPQVDRLKCVETADGRKLCVNCFGVHDGIGKCPHCGFNEGDVPKQPDHLFAGMTLNSRYVIGEVLGAGGFGVSYKAWDMKLDTVIAVKEYYPSGIVNRTPGTKEVIMYARKKEREYEFGKERFLNEARNMAKFNSEKNIVNVFEFFEENSTAYIVMEFLDGITLSDYLRSTGKVGVEKSIDVTNAICDALTKLHAEGIIHRDISPDNIFMCKDGGIKLIDFGTARFAMDENKQMTIVLKPGFAPPEQYEKINKQGPWTDLYALGATLYYILTGIKPEESTNRKVKDSLKYPHELDPKIPINLSNTIMKAMAVEVSMRFKTVKEFTDALNKGKKILPVHIERRRRKQKRFAGIAAAAAVLGAGAYYSYSQYDAEKQANTLPPGNITMWYCKSGDEAADLAEQAAYEAIIQDFNTSFPDVTIKIEGFEEDEYLKKLSSDKKQPNLYEYAGSLSAGVPLDLKEVYLSEFGKACSQLEKAEKCYGSYDYLPLGYNVPVVFRNTSLDSSKDGKIKNVSAMESSAEDADDYTFDNDVFKEMLGAKNSAFSEDAESLFVGGEAVYYATFTDNYFLVQNDLPARYKVCTCDVDRIMCRYDNVWCANKLDKNDDKAALRLLEFMLNENAQDELHIQNNLHSLPINDGLIEEYTDVYNELSPVFEDRERFVFTKNAKADRYN